MVQILSRQILRSSRFTARQDSKNHVKQFNNDRRYLHLSRHSALKLLQSNGIETNPFVLGSSPKDVSEHVKKLGGQATIHAELIPTSGRRSLQYGKYKNIEPGCTWHVKSPQQAEEIANNVISKECTGDWPGVKICNVMSISPRPSGIPKSALSKAIRAHIFADRSRGSPTLLLTHNLDATQNVRSLPDGQSVMLSLELAKDIDKEQLHSMLADLGILDSNGEWYTLINNFYNNIFKKYDAVSTEVRVSPAADGKIVFDDPYFHFDPFGVPRQPELQKLRDLSQEHSGELSAAEEGLFYIKYAGNGNIGCFGYGAGVGMQMCDAVAREGGKVANFADGGGGANRRNAKVGILTLADDPDVTAIFLNLFGGLTRTNLVAEGMIDAIKEHPRLKGGKIPIVARIRGTNSEEANKILTESGLPIKAIHEFSDAAKEIVRIAKNL